MKGKESKPIPKTGIARLLQIAATKKPLVIASVGLSSLASICSFVPYIAIYFIIHELLGAYPDFADLDTSRVILYGWIAFAGTTGNFLLYYGALVCSHLAAFGTLYELKVNFAAHLARVPLGFHVLIGSGKLRKIMDENIEKIESFIAHQLPDVVGGLCCPRRNACYIDDSRLALRAGGACRYCLGFRDTIWHNWKPEVKGENGEGTKKS